MATMKTRPTLGPRELTLWLKIVAAVLALIPAGILLLAGASSLFGSDSEGFGLIIGDGAGAILGETFGLMV